MCHFVYSVYKYSPKLSFNKYSNETQRPVLDCIHKAYTSMVYFYEKNQSAVTLIRIAFKNSDWNVFSHLINMMFILLAENMEIQHYDFSFFIPPQRESVPYILNNRQLKSKIKFIFSLLCLYQLYCDFTRKLDNFMLFFNLVNLIFLNKVFSAESLHILIV